MNKKINFIIIATLFLTASCAMGPKFTTVHPLMNVLQVQKRLGQPQQIIKEKNDDVLYVYKDQFVNNYNGNKADYIVTFSKKDDKYLVSKTTQSPVRPGQYGHLPGNDFKVKPINYFKQTTTTPLERIEPPSFSYPSTSSPLGF